jgi:hypothetical protein
MCLFGGSVDAQEAAVQVFMAQPMNAANPNREVRAKQWIRGLIQQELNAIETLCKPTQEQALQLVDSAETHWKTKLITIIKSYSEASNRQTVDFETRVERLVASWVNETLDEKRAEVWSSEIQDRNEMRKRLIVGKMVCDAEKKFGLTAAQMKEVSGLLAERYRDSWWTSYRAGTVPETKFAWISQALSESQQTMGGERNSNSRIESFTSGGSVDYPSRKVDERFELGGVQSSNSIELERKPKNQEAPAEAKAADAEDDVFGPVIIDRVQLIDVPLIPR